MAHRIKFIKPFQAIILFLLLVFVSACSMLKLAKYADSGTVTPSAFKIELPFEMRFGLIILKVNIHGKDYSFILDTGAPDVISKELAEHLGLKAAGQGKASDSQGSTESLGFTSIDALSIGGLQFINTGTAIADLQRSSEIACFHVDGLIGASLMRKAVWQIDYVRHIITITSSRDSLSLPSNAAVVKFHTNRLGTPLIDVQLNGYTDKDVVVDLGSNADFRSSAETFGGLKEKGLNANIYSYGYGASGLYGRGQQDTTRYATISTIQLGGVQLSNQVVSFNKKGEKTIGTNFFKNYRLIFDWSANQLTMIPVGSYDNTSEKLYNFSAVLKDQKVFVGTVYSTGNVVPDGPKLGDQVLEIDGQDYRNCSGERWCELLSQRFEASKTTSSVLVRRGDQELRFTVSKEALFLKKG